MDIYVSSESIENLTILINDLSAVRTELEDYEVPLEYIKRYMNQRWIQNFAGAGSIYTPWAKLSPTWTIPERGNDRPILFREGGLFVHFLEQNEAGKVSKDAINWSFNNVSGGWTVRHDEGYPNPIANRRDIPSRPLWDINNDDEKRIEQEVTLYVDNVLKSHHF